MTYHRKKVLKLFKSIGNSPFSFEEASDALNVDLAECHDILDNLEAYGYLKRSMITDSWVFSIKGKLLLTAKAPREFDRIIVEQKLKELINRVNEVNSSNKYIYDIKSMKIVSPYPVQKRTKAVYIKYYIENKKIDSDEFRKRISKLNQENNRHSDGISAYFLYPEKAINKYLKSRSHVLKLESVTLEELEASEGTVIFKA